MNENLTSKRLLLQDLKEMISQLKNGTPPDNTEVLALLENIYDKQAELCSEEEATFRTTLYSIGDAVITTDTAGHVRQMNPVAEKLTGWKEQEAKGRPLNDIFRIVNEKTRQPVESPVSKVLRLGTAVGLANHTLLISKNGMQTPISDSGAPIKNESGELTGIVLVFRDQSEERKKQRTVEDSEAKYRSLFFSTNDGICLHQLIFNYQNQPIDYLILDATPRFEEILGISRDFVVGKKATEVYPTTTAPFLDIYAEVAHSGNPTTFETYFEPMGKHFRISVYAPEYGKFATVFQDITIQKEAETRLKESEEKFRGAFEVSPDMISLTRLKDGVYADINEEFIKTSGYSREELIGQSSLNLHIWEDPSDRKFLFDTVMREGFIRNMKAKFRLKDNRVITGLMSARIMQMKGDAYLLAFTRDITELEKTRHSIKVKDELLSLTGKMAKVGGWEFDAQTLEGTWTDEVARIHDLEPGEKSSVELGMSFYINDSRERIEAAVQKAITQGTPYDLELEILTGKGNHKWVRSIGTPIIENGKVKKVQGIFQDITELKISKEQLGNERQMLKTFIETIPDPVWLKDINGTYLTCNHRFEQLFGTSKENIIGKTDFAFLPRHEADFFIGKDREALAANKPTSNLEWITYASDGHRELLETVKTPMYDSKGKLIGILGIGRNITQLKENEARLSAFMNFVPASILICDHDLRLVYANKKSHDLFPIENWAGKKPSDIFSPEVARDMESKDEMALKNGYLEYKDAWVDKMGQTHQLFIQKFRIEIPGSQPLLGAIISDITENERMHEELIKAKNKAEESDHLKSVFLANMSHEIRTPMNAIIGFSDLINEPGIDELEKKQFSEIIRKRAFDLLGLINDIMDISKLEAKQMKITKEYGNVEDILSDLYKTYQVFWEDTENPAVTLSYENELIGAENNIFTDIGRLRQIISNLLNNAIKFTQQGSIRFGCKKKDDQTLLFYVSDTGIGIRPEKINEIFNRFYQVEESTTRYFSGAGLGLSISQGLAALLGGTIQVESEPNIGSTFSFTLPIAKNGTNILTQMHQSKLN